MTEEIRGKSADIPGDQYNASEEESKSVSMSTESLATKMVDLSVDLDSHTIENRLIAEGKFMTLFTHFATILREKCNCASTVKICLKSLTKEILFNVYSYKNPIDVMNNYLRFIPAKIDEAVIRANNTFSDQVTMIELTNGDPHHQGSRPMIISLENGKRYVYKPRSLEIEKAIFDPENGIFAYINNHLGTKLPTREVITEKAGHRDFDAFYGFDTFIQGIPSDKDNLRLIDSALANDTQWRKFQNNMVKKITTDPIDESFRNYFIQMITYCKLGLIEDLHGDNMIIHENQEEVSAIDLEVLNVKSNDAQGLTYISRKAQSLKLDSTNQGKAIALEKEYNQSLDALDLKSIFHNKLNQKSEQLSIRICPVNTDFFQVSLLGEETKEELAGLIMTILEEKLTPMGFKRLSTSFLRMYLEECFTNKDNSYLYNKLQAQYRLRNGHSSSI